MRLKFSIAILACLLLCGCKDKEIEYDQAMEAIKSAFERPDSQSETESMEYMLACIDAGSYVSRDDDSIENFRTLLRQLDSKFIEDVKQIGDASVSTKFLLRDDGIQENLLNIMEGMNQLFSEKSTDVKYAEYTSLYMGLRNEGYSHKKAIEGLQAGIRSKGVY